MTVAEFQDAVFFKPSLLAMLHLRPPSISGLSLVLPVAGH